MKEFIVSTWTMIRLALAYACVLIGMVIGIPGHILHQIGIAFVTLGEKIRGGRKIDNGPAIMKEIADMS